MIVKEDIIQSINEIKRRVGRALNDEEIAIIIRNYKASILDKAKIIRLGKSGLDDVDYFYNELTEDKKEFLLSSIAEMEKKAKSKADFIAESEYPSQQLINEYYDYLMKLIYLKNTCGLPIDEYQDFIGAHEDLYNEIFNGRKEKTV